MTLINFYRCCSRFVLDKAMLNKLERLSGLRFESINEIHDLEEDINFAQKIFDVNTEGVEPLYNIIDEHINCPLREDVLEKTSKKDVLLNTKSSLEDFFVSPPANIPLNENELFKKI